MQRLEKGLAMQAQPVPVERDTATDRIFRIARLLDRAGINALSIDSIVEPNRSSGTNLPDLVNIMEGLGLIGKLSVIEGALETLNTILIETQKDLG